jgi:hypothetical protein
MLKLILIERLADGSVNRIPPKEWFTLKAKVGANYTVIDDNTGAPPERMRLYRTGRILPRRHRCNLYRRRQRQSR